MKQQFKASQRDVFPCFSLKALLTVILISFTVNAFSQGKVEDYNRAWNLRKEYNGKVKNANVQARPLSEPHKFVYTLEVDDTTQTFVIDAETNTVEPYKEEGDGERNNRWGDRRPRGDWGGFGGPLQGGEQRKLTWHQQQHHWMTVDPENDECGDTHLNRDLVLSWKQNNLFLGERQLTTDGVDTFYYSIHATLSPDGKYIATTKIKPAPKHMITYVNSSPRDQVQPKYRELQYTKPGDSLNYRVPVIIELETGKVNVPSTALFEYQYEVSAPHWDENSKTVTFEFNERGHKTFRVLEMDVNANVRVLIEETNPKYVAYSRNYRHDFRDGNRILWKSDRDNHAHLYLYDRRQGNVGRQITKGDFWVRSVQRIDEEKGIIWFTANGRNPDEDPYFIHYYRINLDGTGLVDLTPANGTHRATFTQDMEYLVDTYSSVDNPPVTELRSGIDGHLIREIARADISKLLKTGWKAPEIFVAPGRDGKTPMWGLIVRPSNFNPKKKYPVIEYIYSGPGDQYVPKSFSTWYGNLSDLAELGFIVVQLDGMTTSFRTLEFEQVCYKNLKDAGFPDRIEWIKAAAKKYKYMDISRMGIYGCSAGGQEALGGLLFHGDFYKVGYSACGCHDNRMDKIWWNEQWMGTVDKSYEECSNVVNAKNLTGKLMLVVGEMDDNVDPSSTFQVVDALTKANKDFEFIYLPGANHTMGNSYGEHKRYDFFVKNLLGVEPPAWSEWDKNQKSE